MNLKVYSSRDFPAYLPKLNELYDDLFTGGKGFRSLLTQKVSKPLGLDENTVKLLCQTIEFVHNASLLHDDLVDRSHLRRGKPAAWLKYSPEYAVLAGDYLLARVMCNLSSFGNIELVQFTSQTIGELLEGEWIQDSLVGDFSIGLEQLTEVHNLKTASLFRWCFVAPLIAKEETDQQFRQQMLEMGTILGYLLQRSDDLLDFDIRNYEKKAVLGDLKSDYLNSFGAFLTQGWPTEKVMGLKLADDIDQLKNLVGEEYFAKRLADFDSVNEEMIAVYNHHLQRLADGDSGSRKELVQELSGLPELLYWRKKPAKGTA